MCQDAASNTTTFAIALWATEPLDTLNNALQLIDCDKNSVQELCYTRGLLQTCQKRLWQMATGSEEPDVPLSMLVQQLSCYPGCNQCEVQEEARNKAMFLSGFVWARFETVVQSPPWSLTQIVDPRVSESEQRRRLQAYHGRDFLFALYIRFIREEEQRMTPAAEEAARGGGAIDTASSS